ncbi:hypothetical protein BJX64DRAFT_268673 [Aspergillus heterothallicus]
MSPPQSENNDRERRRRRASRPKVRSGCATCKSRHKKCDEGRPSCAMCLRTGRKCEYRETLDGRTRSAREMRIIAVRERASTHDDTYDYFPPSDEVGFTRGGLVVAPGLISTNPDLAADERRYLDFFRSTTAAQCAGYFYDEFWQRLVHRVSEAEPAVCHAVISLGSLNCRFLQRRMGMAGDERSWARDAEFSLRQSNKAIACLRRVLEGEERLGRQRTEIALVVCVVLVSTMLFQEDAVSAGRHLRSGLTLLEAYLSDNPAHSAASVAITQAFAGVLLSWLTFSTPDAEAVEGAQTYPFLVPRAFPEIAFDINKAGDFVVALARLVLLGHPEALTWAGGQDAVIQKLRGWGTQIKQSAITHQARLSRRDRSALMLLELWSEVLYIILKVGSEPPPRESRYDAYLAGFQHSVQLARELLKTDTSVDPIPTFSVNLGIIAPLFYCGLRCRDWLVRQEALLLLRRWRRQEGIWSSNTTARVLARLIDVESTGLTPEDVIPESSRIEAVHVDMPVGGSGLCLRYRRPGTGEWMTEWLA